MERQRKGGITLKKAASILAIVFCLGILLSLPVTGVTDDIYFSVVNDRLQELSDETMPYYSNGKMYVPFKLFEQSSLGTYSIYDDASNTATIYSTLHYLRFNFSSGNTYDDAGRVFSYWAIFHNSTVYVPAENVCSFFGFEYSMYYTPPAPFVRIKNSNARFSDSDFAKNKYLSMQSDYNAYLNIPVQTASPEVTPTPTTSPEEPENNTSVYLSFRGINESTSTVLDSLSYYGFKACFFVTADEIRKNQDLIRQISGSGHTIGFVCTANLTEDYKTCSELLRTVCKVKSIIVTLDAQYSAELKDAADNLGLILWSDSGSNVYGLNSSKTAREINRMLDSSGDRLDLSFICSSDTEDLIDDVLYYLYLGDCTVSLIRETTTTYLNTSGVY